MLSLTTAPVPDKVMTFIPLISIPLLNVRLPFIWRLEFNVAMPVLVRLMVRLFRTALAVRNCMVPRSPVPRMLRLEVAEPLKSPDPVAVPLSVRVLPLRLRSPLVRVIRPLRFRSVAKVTLAFARLIVRLLRLRLPEANVRLSIVPLPVIKRLELLVPANAGVLMAPERVNELLPMDIMALFVVLNVPLTARLLPKANVPERLMVRLLRLA